jgi:glucosamine-6-phosphate deaminase
MMKSVAEIKRPCFFPADRAARLAGPRQRERIGMNDGRAQFGPQVRIFADRNGMGRAAAADIAAAMRARLEVAATVRMIFAAAPSQSEMLASLAVAPGIDWSRVTAFHMDEYIGLPATAPQRFGLWLKAALFDRVKPGRVHLIDAAAASVDGGDAYAALLAAAPIDFVCLGIGVNGHIAFNDPGVADFDDPRDVKLADLDDVCRRQQVDDGCFAAFADVPVQAVTLTIPRLLRAERLFCVVPGATKRAAVTRALAGPIDAACPASVLRRHSGCTLYLDHDSAPADGAASRAVGG